MARSPEQMGGMRKFAYEATKASQVVDAFTIGIGVIASSSPLVALGIVGLVSGEYVKGRLKGK